MKESLNTTRPAVANHATSAAARRMRRTVQRGLAGPALEMAQAIDFDKLADLWSDLDLSPAGRRRR